jgi:hypothetical protein
VGQDQGGGKKGLPVLPAEAEYCAANETSPVFVLRRIDIDDELALPIAQPDRSALA